MLRGIRVGYMPDAFSLHSTLDQPEMVRIAESVSLE